MKNARVINLLLTLLRLGLGIFFAYTSLAKVGDIGETANFITRSRLLPEWCSTPIACIGVAMEFLVAVGLLLRKEYRGATAWGVIMTFVFLLFYINGWARGLELTCNCLGSSHELVNYPSDIAMRTLLLGAMLLLVWDARQTDAGLNKPRKFDFSEM